MNEEIIMKECQKCKISKQLGEFGKYSRSKDGLRPICKPCKSNQDKTRYIRSKLDMTIAEMIQVTAKAIAFAFDNPDELKKLSEKMIKLSDDLKIEKSANEHNSFVVPQSEEYLANPIKLRIDVTMKFLNTGLFVSNSDIHVVNRGPEYLIQVDNLVMTPVQKAFMQE